MFLRRHGADDGPSLMANPRSEVAVVVRALAHWGIQIADPAMADQVGATVISELEAFRRRGVKVAASQCGAPTLNGWPCRNQKLSGKRGCGLHPTGR